MKKSIGIACFLFLFSASYGQILSSPKLYLGAIYTRTISDITKGNNPWGLGISAQIFTKGNGWLQPTVELSNSAFLEDDQVLRYVNPLPPDQQNADYYALPGKSYPSFDNMTNVLVGAAAFVTRFTYFSFTAGPSLTNRLRWSAKPAVGFCFPKNQRVMLTFSHLTIFKKIKDTNTDYTAWSIGLSVRLH